MELVLMCRDASGSAAFPSGMIDGKPVQVRRYTIDNHVVCLSGQPDWLLHHDAGELLGHPDGLYRMPTPAEQDKMAKAEQAAASVQEAAAPALKKTTAEVNGG